MFVIAADSLKNTNLWFIKDCNEKYINQSIFDKKILMVKVIHSRCMLMTLSSATRNYFMSGRNMNFVLNDVKLAMNKKYFLSLRNFQLSSKASFCSIRSSKQKPARPFPLRPEQSVFQTMLGISAFS